MNMPGIDRSILPTHFATIEANNPIKSSGFCRAAASGMYSPITDWTFSLRNVRGSIFSGWSMRRTNLSDLLGRPVGIVVVSGRKDREAEEFPRIVQTV
jgi:hypothetical protein